MVIIYHKGEHPWKLPYHTFALFHPLKKYIDSIENESCLSWKFKATPPNDAHTKK